MVISVIFVAVIYFEGITYGAQSDTGKAYETGETLGTFLLAMFIFWVGQKLYQSTRNRKHE